jgi:hypothetical protein
MNLLKEEGPHPDKAGRQVRLAVSGLGGSGYLVTETQPIVHLKLARQAITRHSEVARKGRPVGLP